MKALFIIVTICLTMLTAFTVVHSSGNVFTTGSPYDGANCSTCHSGGTSIPSVTITSSPAFPTGSAYMPGMTYTINVIVSGSYTAYGFNLEVLDSNSPSAANDAGMCGPAVSSNCTKFVSSGNPTNYTHNVPSGSAGSATFSFQWTAPMSGPVYFYVSGLGVNLNASSGGDRCANYSLMLNPVSGVAQYDNSKLSVSVFPNPAREVVRVQLFALEKGVVAAKLLNSEGTLVSMLHDMNCTGGPGSFDIRLPEGLPAGIYYLNVRLNHSEVVKKLILD